MITPADRAVKKKVTRLASRIEKLYAKACDELEKKAQDALNEYNNDFAAMDAKYRNKEITYYEYQKWIQDTLDMSKRYRDIRDAVVNSILQCDHIATDWIAQTAVSVWRDDMLYSTYLIEGMTHGGVSLRLLDDQAIQRLVQRTPHLLPVVNDAKNSAYMRKKFRNEITQGIIQGESIPKIAARIENVTGADENAAIRQARTAVTSARNGARQEVAERAVDMGIEIKKRWTSTLDYRTRDSHQHLDGETVDVDDWFSNGLAFPGDPDGAPEELYNCRCTMTYVDSLSGKPPRRDGLTGDVIGWTTYDDWIKTK